MAKTPVEELIVTFKEYELHPEEIENLHRLRVKCRKALSLMSRNNPAYETVQGIIKGSNKIRDIDVFLSVFLRKFDYAHYEQIKQSGALVALFKEKMVLEHTFWNQLKGVNFDDIVLDSLDEDTQKKELEAPSKKLALPKHDKRALHKLRLEVKKYRYFTETTTDNPTLLLILKTLQDKLGEINDNYNGDAILKRFLADKKLYKKLHRFIVEQNGALYNEVDQLLQSLDS